MNWVFLDITNLSAVNIKIDRVAELDLKIAIFMETAFMLNREFGRAKKIKRYSS